MCLKNESVADNVKMTLALNVKEVWGGDRKLAEHYANKNTAHTLRKEGERKKKKKDFSVKHFKARLFECFLSEWRNTELMRVRSNPEEEKRQESSWESCYSLIHNKNVDKIWIFWSLGKVKQLKLRQWIK